MRRNGFIEFVQFDWRNKIPGNDFNTPLSSLKNKEYIHIGYHRTGTTFLQKDIFPKCEPYADIFSNESMTGALFNNGLSNIDRIYKTVPEAKIILVIRQQMSIINSSFRNYIRKGGTYTFSEYAEKIIECRRYDYAKLISKYHNRFGEENCAVFLYEDLKDNPCQFIALMLKFMGIRSIGEFLIEKVNKSPTKYYNEYARWINILHQALLNIIGSMHSEKQNEQSTRTKNSIIKEKLIYLGRMADEKIIRNFVTEDNAGKQIGCGDITDRVRKAYNDSNGKLERILNRDLKGYGYL